MSESKDDSETDLIKEYIESIGDEFVTEKTVKSTGGNEAKMLVCLHGQHTYFIVRYPDHPFERIQYRFSLVEQIAPRLSHETIAERTGKEPEEDTAVESIGPNALEVPEEDIHIAQPDDEFPPEIEAAENVIEDLDQDILERLGLNLFRKLSDPAVSTRLDRTENGHFQGFVLSRKIFPSDSGFSLTEFNDSVQSVISLGTFGTNWVEDLMDSELGGIEEIQQDE